MKGQWIPEIMYEESEDGISSHIPFIMVPKDKKYLKDKKLLNAQLLLQLTEF